MNAIKRSNSVSRFDAPALYSSIIFWNSSKKFIWVWPALFFFSPPQRLFCHTGSNLSNADLNRLLRPAHMANIVLNRVQHLVDTAGSSTSFPRRQPESHSHFRHHMRRYGKRIRIGHHIN